MKNSENLTSISSFEAQHQSPAPFAGHDTKPGAASTQSSLTRTHSLLARLHQQAECSESEPDRSLKYMAISPEAGKLLYMLIRNLKPEQVFEFGTSMGVSGLYLASALEDNGRGQLISCELDKGKVEKARSHFSKAGLDHRIQLCQGDALQMVSGLPGPIDFVFLDGHKELYLPLLKALEPKLADSALVVADDTHKFANKLASYLDYVREPGKGFISSTPLTCGDGMELSLFARG
ncbi:O-methyltransferase [Dongshaea marina]|uniref:O-methyltransferase n=1 Tax=Dongshaea marina TaxID=2047966 RepID=UPI000D3E23DF|nr:class I SAM-dependent methyltransferase [Dongshaea marina]